MKYRPEIDGLRAIAVVPVLLYHMGLSIFSGGFFGVDVFFVISGYLITTILYQQSIEGRFSIINFYDRRIRRILPPLVLTSLLTVAISATFTPSDIKNVGQSLVATFTFLSNYFFYLETDYFNPFNQATPMLHTWSLAVEEQYYIAAPFIIYLLTKNLRYRYGFTILLMIISFYLAVKTSTENSILSFYSIHTRAWELMAGSLVAFYIVDRKNAGKNNHQSNILSIMGVILVITSYLGFDSSISHPSYFTLTPIIGTTLIILFTGGNNITQKILSTRVLVSIGLISYPVYLFHNPIFSFIKYHYSSDALLYKWLSLPIILGMAIFSYRFVENKVRDNSATPSRMFYPGLAIIVTMALATGLSAHLSNGFLELHRQQVGGNLKLLVDVDYERRLIDQSRRAAQPTSTAFSCKTKNCYNLLILGDSFSEDAYLSMASIEENRDVLSIRRVWYDDPCLSRYQVSNVKQHCAGKEIDLSLLHDADIVIITEKWQESTYKDGYAFARKIEANFDAKVIVVGSVMFEDLSSFAFKLKEIQQDPEKISQLAYRSQRFDRLRISDKLKTLVNNDKNIDWIERFDFFCERNLETCNLYDEEYNPLIWDNAHLTVTGHPKYGHFLYEKIERIAMIGPYRENLSKN